MRKPDMADFTLNTYIQLLQTLMEQDFSFQTFGDYLTQPAKRSIVLRHDVDKRPQNSLELAKIESEFGLKGTYNFRARPCSWDEAIIKEISNLGHEIGYHYEELCTYKGDREKAFEAFQRNLEKLRQLAPVSTICMHGSPRSKHDSRDLWKSFDYKELDLMGEPYLDMDFSRVLYLSDTGRRWDGQRVSVRDKVDQTQTQLLQQKGNLIHSTRDIIKAANEKALPDTLMLTIHPQRWHNNKVLWLSELISQNLKNEVKRVLNLKRQ
ncbi:MAG: hypothetical protein P1P86_15820 [Bacteroidales bacterium]|nr:hypothetical protein [Bacteroidales bacterium]